ncbi:non-ribosomal peptide synthetase [Dorea formicigenerans]|uniref:Phenyloxazoline synthase MbtB n=1 Tax=Dorea formicigenerans TaxID=39486 RepID=A0A564TWE8_9FIRM|nr:non-ribosomal peptide synthetase [Dorea formicigenerans]VUX11535.1 Phenyloxazoline synthase MbtB [Dorea formicigenerans]
MDKIEIKDITCEQIEKSVQEILNIYSNIPYEKNLLELGLSSIQIMQLTSRWRKEGYICTFAQLISQPTIQSWKTLLKVRENKELEEQIVQKETEDMYKPFPLTEVQYAYWVGRKEGQQIGQVGCHGYLEVDGYNVEPKRLEYAWEIIQMHHPMLRVLYTKDGMQQIMPHPYHSGIRVYDYREKNAEEHLRSIRENLSHRLLDIEHGQVAELQLTLLPSGKTRIHFDIDLLVADVKSFQIILRDLAHTYVTGELPKAPAEWNFADFIKRNVTEKQSFKQSEKYWLNRLKSLPGRPELPLQNCNKEVIPTFHRRKSILRTEQWQSFRHFAMENSITPAMALLTLYGSVIARWSQSQKFLMNIPLFNRNEEEIEEVVADFTTLLLLEMDFTEKSNFLEAAKKVQKQFHQDMGYINYSGIRVEREYKKQYPQTDMVAPIVFSCNLGIPLINQEFESYLGHMGYMISQTPQVWLDFQLFDVNDGMLMIWDSVDEVFPEHLLDDMFDAYTEALKKLAEDKKYWTEGDIVSIEKQLEIRKSFERMDNTIPKGPIYGSFFKFAAAQGDSIAIIDEMLGAITYSRLSSMARSVATFLLNNHIKKEESIGVACCRGVGQIAAILGVLAAGGKYVIVGNMQPIKRKSVICEKAKIRVVLTDMQWEWEQIADIRVAYLKDVLKNEPIAEPAPIEGKESAYVIFTSGTTGQPKGVEITHQAAFNTIYSINKMYQIDEQDSILAISNTDFDLSVYDIFGMLSVGGKLILLSDEKRKDAKHWCKLMKEHSITIWNSVPVLLDMFILEAKAQQMSFENLRCVMQSGDWIDIGLVEQIKQVAGNAQFIAMGGATEASIWSNYQEVTLPIPQRWKSIPYGHPLPNQKYRVVNTKLQDCPDLVEGELWIGGAGVAVGYINEPTITAEKFPIYMGERWYRTGDYGRFWKDGTIEFLGRRDYQVKIRGHRIELEEIENNIRKSEKVEQAVVIPIEKEQGNKYLAGFIVPVCAENVKFKEINSLIYKKFREQFCSENNSKFFTEDIETIENCFDMAAKKIMYRVIKSRQETGQEILPEYKKLYEKWQTILADDFISNNEAVQEPIAYLEAIKEELSLFENQADKLITGKIEPYDFMLENHFFHMDRIADKMPGAREKNDLLYHFGINFMKQKADDEEIRILEIGAGKPQYTKLLLDSLCEKKIRYVLLETTNSHFDEAREILANYDIQYETKKLSDKEIRCIKEAEKYDLILAADSLHREEDVEQALKNIKAMLKHEGILLVGEKTKQDLLAFVTAGILEKKKEGKVTLYTNKEWENWFTRADFAIVKSDGEEALWEKRFGQYVFLGLPKTYREKLDKEEVINGLQDLVPEYMIPSALMFLEHLPVTNNGKIDRKYLIELQRKEKVDFSKTKPQGEFEIRLARIWENILHVHGICLEDDFYLLGGDSLLATKMVIEIKKEFQIEITLEEIFQNPLFKKFLNVMREKWENRLEVDTEFLPKVILEPEHKFELFPMTDIQQSYWIGRSGAYDLGNVGAHCYFEMDCPKMDSKRLEKAWNALIERHEMMRAVMAKDGKNQKILPIVPYYVIRKQTYENLQEAEKDILALRNEMAKNVFDATEWPLFDIRISEIGAEMTRLHLSFDNIVFDGFSIFKIFYEWKMYYEKNQVRLPEINGSFRDYVIAQEELKDTESYKKQLNYWKKRVETMPPAPQLPVVETIKGKNQGFTRFEMHLGEKEREKIKQYTESYHLTSTVVFLTAYAQVLGRYSKSQHFTLNLTRFQRLPLFEGVENLIGDFTTLTLLEIDLRKGNTFLERCKAIQEQLLMDMKNALVSGVVIEREWQRHQKTKGVSMPVVFTSGFGINSKYNGTSETLGEIIYGESQTPQVWLDHQVSEQNGQLFLSWDAVCGLFPGKFIETMFESYQEIIYALLKRENWISCQPLITQKNIKQIQKETWKYNPITGNTLLSLYEKSAKCYSERIAIETMYEKVTYAQCQKQVNLLSGNLMQLGVQKGDVVAIYMDKGIGQIYAALAIMKAGAIYLPMDISNPAQRIQNILVQAQPKIVLTEKSGITTMKQYLLEWDTYDIWDLLRYKNFVSVEYPIVKDTDLAYIIYTSGSTGLPKGVIIDHRGVVNTILDINMRFGVNKDDSTIWVSNLNFDLSVYDIFGMLSVGGKIMIPDAERKKEPSHWIEILQNHQVTIWNSVPAFLQMLLEYKDSRKENLFHTLRLIFMSGDWVPVALPDQLKEIFNGVKVVALGGATEASIWSNYYVIPDGVPQNWKSIPYGKPLTNQRFYILNELMESCPVWVTGELYIAGIGVAKGYYKDRERTEKAFIFHQELGEILYRTGDLGRFMEDGNIEFLGREDTQIKKNGYRIECGEIEAQIRNIEGIKEVVVSVDKEKQMMLTAHICLQEESRLCKYIGESSLLSVNDFNTVLFEKLLDKSQIDAKIIEFQEAVSMLAMEILCKDLQSFEGILDLDSEKKELKLSEQLVSNTGAVILDLYKQQIKRDSSYRSGKTLQELIDFYYEQWTSFALKDVTGERLWKLRTRLEQSRELRWAILTGTKKVKELLIEKNTLFPMPTELSTFDATKKIFTDGLKQFFDILKKSSQGRTLRILEVGSRASDNTELLIGAWGKDGEITYGDESNYYIDSKREQFKNHICYQHLQLEEKSIQKSEQQFDLILADNTLHRMKNISIAVENLKELLTPGGILIICENTKNVPLMLLTTAYLEDGYSYIEDERKKNHLPMVSQEDWVSMMKEKGLEPIVFYPLDKEKKLGKQLMMFQKKEVEVVADKELIREEMSKVLPEYMIPENISVYKKFPLSENGKIDRGKLADLAKYCTPARAKKIKEPVSELEKSLLAVWIKVMKTTQASVDDNFFTSGGDSLKAIIFINALKEQLHYEISLQDLFENPSVQQLAAFLKNRQETKETIETIEGEI